TDIDFHGRPDQRSPGSANERSPLSTCAARAATPMTAATGESSRVHSAPAASRWSTGHAQAAPKDKDSRSGAAIARNGALAAAARPLEEMAGSGRASNPAP